jgi:uncharacterized membrane-anchored protein
MGENAADFLSVNLGLTATSLLMTVVLIGALVLQFDQRRYVPWACWLAVVLISVVGTLAADNLAGNLGIRLWTTVWVFILVRAAVFAAWWLAERGLGTVTTSGFFLAAIILLVVFLSLRGPVERPA